MSSEPTKPAMTEAASSTNGTPADLRQEVERLRETVKRLEEVHRLDAERLKEVERERDEFRRIVYDHARSLFSEEQLTRIPDEKDCLPFEAFAAELSAT